jgi:glycerol-3-phosphate acyltransferase PlsY
MPWMEQLQSANWSHAGSIGLGAYGLGCIATGYYLVLLSKRMDIRETGSGSIGAKNVGRILGWPGFILTVLGDIGKGSFAIWAARHFTTDERIVALALVAVVIGHLWPVQLMFRGGKGVATSLGALLVYDHYLTVAWVISFAIVFAVMRKTVLPALFAFMCLPLVSLYHYRDDSGKAFALSVLAGLIVMGHRRNVVEEFYHLAERRKLEPRHDRNKL